MTIKMAFLTNCYSWSYLCKKVLTSFILNFTLDDTWALISEQLYISLDYNWKCIIPVMYSLHVTNIMETFFCIVTQGGLFVQIVSFSFKSRGVFLITLTHSRHWSGYKCRPTVIRPGTLLLTGCQWNKVRLGVHWSNTVRDERLSSFYWCLY